MSSSTSSSSSDEDLFRNLDLSWVDELSAGQNARKGTSEPAREKALRNSSSESDGLEDPFSREQEMDCQDEQLEEEEDEPQSQNSVAKEKEMGGSDQSADSEGIFDKSELGKTSAELAKNDSGAQSTYRNAAIYLSFTGKTLGDSYRIHESLGDEEEKTVITRKRRKPSNSSSSSESVEMEKGGKSIVPASRIKRPRLGTFYLIALVYYM